MLASRWCCFESNKNDERSRSTDKQLLKADLFSISSFSISSYTWKCDHAEYTVDIKSRGKLKLSENRHKVRFSHLRDLSNRIFKIAQTLGNITFTSHFPSRFGDLFADQQSDDFLNERKSQISAFFEEVFKIKDPIFLVEVSWCIRHWLGVDEDLIGASLSSPLLRSWTSKRHIRPSAVLSMANNLEKQAEDIVQHPESPRTALSQSSEKSSRVGETNPALAKEIDDATMKIIKHVAEVKLLRVEIHDTTNSAQIRQLTKRISTLRKDLDILRDEAEFELRYGTHGDRQSRSKTPNTNTDDLALGIFNNGSESKSCFFGC